MLAAYILHFVCKHFARAICIEETNSLAQILTVHPRGSDPGLHTKIPFDMFHIYIAPLRACEISAEHIDNCLSYCEV